MYQRYSDEARVRQHEQDLRREAAAERALRAARATEEQPVVRAARSSYLRRLLTALLTRLQPRRAV